MRLRLPVSSGVAAPPYATERNQSRRFIAAMHRDGIINPALSVKATGTVLGVGSWWLGVDPTSLAARDPILLLSGHNRAIVQDAP